MAQTARPPAEWKLNRLGRAVPRASRAIAASPLSIGFECLDRKHFEPERTYAHLAGLGVKWARVQTGWSRCERTKGVLDFGWLDQVVDRLLECGVQPWFNLGYGNKLYTPEAPKESAVGWVPLYSSEARQGWLRFVQGLAHHFRNRVRHWEIWNEPNSVDFWKPKARNPAEYAEFVKLTAPEIRRRVRGAVIIGGALGGPGLDYLQDCLNAGMEKYIDRYSYHPYRPNPDTNYDADVRAIRALLGRYSSRIAIWQGECGCPSATGGSGAMSHLDWTEQRQARWLLRRVLGDLNAGIELISYFHMSDFPSYFEAAERQGAPSLFGLLRLSDYAPKPSYRAYQCLCSLFDAETGKLDLGYSFSKASRGQSLVVEAIRCASFVRRDCAVYAYWYPADLFEDFAPQTIAASFWYGSMARFSTPVLLDPLTTSVYSLDKLKEKPGAKYGALPIADYPLIVTDRRAVEWVTSQDPSQGGA